MKSVTIRPDGTVREPVAGVLDVLVEHEGGGRVKLTQGAGDSTGVIFLSQMQARAVVEAIEEGD